MKIKKITINNRKKCFEIQVTKGLEYLFPYSKLEAKPSKGNKIIKVVIDKEIKSEGIIYTLTDGNEGTLHIDDILLYNKDPDYMKEIRLHNLTCEAIKIVKKKNISKSELARRLKATRMQLNRLLDPSFYGKTTDQMIKLLTALDYNVELVLKKAS